MRLRVDEGAQETVGLILRVPQSSDQRWTFAWNREPAVVDGRLPSLTEDEARTLTTLRVEADLIEVPDLTRFERLAAVELEFRVPLAGWSAESLAECLAEDVPPCLWGVEAPRPGAGRETARRLAEHTSRWIEHASRWLGALPDNLSYLRLENIPIEALAMLPRGIEHLELIDVYGERDLSLENIRTCGPCGRSWYRGGEVA